MFSLKSQVIIFGGVVYFVSFVAIVCALSSTMADPVPFSKSISQFAVDLYQKAVAEKGGNVILSPLSVQTAVSLAFMGAKGKTAEEMASVMRYGSTDRNTIANNFATLLETYKSSPLLKIANKIYVKDSYVIKSDFNNIATKKFNSEAQSLDFTQSVPSAQTINTWVEEKTNHKIKDLISPDSLDSLTRMVLVNAIYFKGMWANKFDVDRTDKQKFWTSDTHAVNVDMMHHTAEFKYGNFRDLDATAIEMPYQDSDLSMLVILPNKRDGLAKLEADLSSVDLSELTNQMHKQEVIVSFPRFKIEFEINLNDVLEKMGMGTMFSDNADFSDLLESPEPLKVSEVVHKAFIEVNEEGAEAAAATGILVVSYSAITRLVPPPKFKADHPFFYAILDKKNNAFSFFGNLKQF